MSVTKKKVIIFDLDNTIYPVASIAKGLFGDLYRLIGADGRYTGEFEDIKYNIERKPFQLVAAEFHFNEELTALALALLADLEYNGPMAPFDDYPLTRDIDCLKFLVTTGFTKLQWSKIRQLNLQADFEACYVVDPASSQQTKKDVFAGIMDKYRLNPEEVLVVGDDLQSEIKAGRELGIDTVVYDYAGKFGSLENHHVITNFDALNAFI
ncbi:HAD family hydrolase [Parapedobacter sp. 10938]|uniref:HAD family hydrolase n=1 Tax=Parapedobacter flavus TaxID=3110225 RepID=UPI002DB64ABD|nr:HAD family hydrolase [Parapedobacter sp. 10938]MEC3879705.1 HAD family hydrolase [Parapedobacter sp. 10938]